MPAGLDLQPDLGLDRGIVLLLGDHTGLEHALEHDVAAVQSCLGVVAGVEAPRLLDQAGQQRGLRQRQLGRGGREVVPRGGLDAVRAVAVVRDVQVALQDLVLGHLLLERDRVLHLLDLAPEVLVHRGLRGLLVAGGEGVLLEGELDELLGERGRALAGVTALGVVDRGAEHALRVDAAVLAEAVVLDGDLRVLHDLGDLGQRDHDAVLVVERRDHVTVGIQDA